MAVKEFREFFLRNVPVNSGVKKDQETGFITTYLVKINGVLTNVFNRFLKGNYPSENVFRKLFESITFKLNQEDTAKSTEQGLVKIGSDSNVADQIDAATNAMTYMPVPHQLYNVITNHSSTDGVIIITTRYMDITTSTLYTTAALAAATGHPFRKVYIIDTTSIGARGYNYYAGNHSRRITNLTTITDAIKALNEFTPISLYSLIEPVHAIGITPGGENLVDFIIDAGRLCTEGGYIDIEYVLDTRTIQAGETTVATVYIGGQTTGGIIISQTDNLNYVRVKIRIINRNAVAPFNSQYVDLSYSAQVNASSTPYCSDNGVNPTAIAANLSNDAHIILNIGNTHANNDIILQYFNVKLNNQPTY